jgi:hypothetical protein
MRQEGREAKARSLVPGIVAIAALLLAGCGGGGGDAPPSKAEFEKQALAICGKKFERISTGIQRYARENPGTETASWKEGLTRQGVLPALKLEVEEFEELTAPKGGEKELEEIVKAFGQVLKDGEEKPLVILEGSGGPALEKVNKLFVAYGIPQCKQS